MMNPEIMRNLGNCGQCRDHVVSGLWARANSGKVSFYYLYRWAGQRRNPKIGEWPAMTIAQARDICREMHKQVLLGHDPRKQQDADRAAVTVNDLADRYLKVHAPKKKTGDQDRRLLARSVRPVIGKLKVPDVRTMDIEDLHQRYADRTAQGNRILALLSKMFNLAEKWEMRPQGTNPCRHVDRYAEGKRRRYMTREEAGAVVARLKFYEARYPQQAAFLWLLIYTGARPSEIAALRPEHLEGSRIVLAEHKTAESTGEARIIQLPPQAVAMLETLPRIKGQPLVGVQSCRKLWERIMADTGIKDLRVYDMRHSFASIGLSNGKSLAEIGELLGHQSPETTKRYAHLMDEHAAKSAADIADAFDAFAKPKLRAVK